MLLLKLINDPDSRPLGFIATVHAKIRENEFIKYIGSFRKLQEIVYFWTREKEHKRARTIEMLGTDPPQRIFFSEMKTAIR